MSDKIPLQKLQAYLSGIVQFRTFDYTISEWIRAVTKWIFDLLRNAIIAGVLKYLADKSSNLYLRILAEVAFFALLAYCISYLQTWNLRPFHPMKNQKIARILDVTVYAVIFGSLFWLIAKALPAAIEAVAQGQAR